MKIMIMRHTEALSRDIAGVPYDADRPLSETGKVQAGAIGKFLQRESLLPNPIVCSPFIRTQETASLIAAELEESVSPLPLTILAPGSGNDELLQASQNFADTKNRWMLAVLHEPDVGQILGSLLFDGRSFPLAVKPGDLFLLDVVSGHGKSCGQLVASFSPALLFDT